MSIFRARQTRLRQGKVGFNQATMQGPDCIGQLGETKIRKGPGRDHADHIGTRKNRIGTM
jgi:hypothetical protein